MSGIYEDSRRYDLIYENFAEDLPFYQTAAADTAGPICDLACGTGRVTLPVAAAFPERAVYAVDNAPEQLAGGRERARERGVENIAWRAGSIAEVAPPERCGFALCALHSLEHLTEEDELDRFFDHLRSRVLAEGGVFAFALHLPDPHYLIRDPEELRLLGRYGEGEKSFTLYEKSDHDPARQLLTLSWFFEPAGEGEMEAVTYSLRLFYPREIRRVLGEHRFELLGHWGWYDRAPLSVSSATQVLLARC